MTRTLKLVLAGILLLMAVGGCAPKGKAISAFCGSASKPAMEEAAEFFEQETGGTD